MLELTQEEIGQTISRANQIVEQQSAAPANPSAGYEAYVSAAEEIGIPRDAMLQALRERQLLPVDSVSPGDSVFALSADNAFYPATIVRVVNDASIVVKFVAGGEHTVSAYDIRPQSMVPGRLLQFQHEDLGEGIWFSGRLVDYNPVKQVATVSNGYMSFTVSINRIRLKGNKPQVAKAPASVRQLLLRATLIAGSTAGGIGFLLGYLLHAH